MFTEARVISRARALGGKDMILVTGATGKVGRHLVAGLLAEDAPVRALTRRPASTALPAGAEVAGFDPGRPDTIEAALDGASAIFLNATAVGSVLPTLLTSAARAGVRRAVLLSSMTVRDNGVQPYSIGAQHKVLEDAVTAAAGEWTVLRCGGFAANTLAWAPAIRAEGVVRAPYRDAATAPIAEQDIAAAAVRVLLDSGHQGARYVLTGPQSLTQADQAQAIGAAIGRELRFEELPPEAFRQAAVAYMPAGAVDDLLRYLAEYVGRTAEMSDDLVKITGLPGMTLAAWAADRADSFR
jgi:uncharacterized protein YbjT (DUF2867 family)